MPRHWRSGWQRMWPKRAFHDQNFFPHSVHGRVIFGADGSGLLEVVVVVLGVGLGEEEEEEGISMRTNLVRFLRWWGAEEAAAVGVVGGGKGWKRRGVGGEREKSGGGRGGGGRERRGVGEGEEVSSMVVMDCLK